MKAPTALPDCKDIQGTCSYPRRSYARGCNPPPPPPSPPPACLPPRLLARSFQVLLAGASLPRALWRRVPVRTQRRHLALRRRGEERRVPREGGTKRGGWPGRASPNQEDAPALFRSPFGSGTPTRATPLLLPFAMGLPLLLGLLLSQVGKFGVAGLPSLVPFTHGGFQVMSFEQPNNCVTAENLCLAEPSCSATYQILQNCSQHLSKNSYIFLYQEAKNRCTEAQIKMRNGHFQHCKCHRRGQKKEERCLQIYRALHSTLTQGSPRAKGSPNACLLAANICQMDHKCTRQRSHYAQACSTVYPCDQHKCHQSLRHFFEKVNADFTKRLLFCPCQDEACGERRWQTIVPECSFLSSSKPSCLLVLDTCLKDKVCRSRLTDFQEKCKSFQALTDGCSPSNYAACLQAYMKMIGTSLTPNYVSNSSTEITLWCSCRNSGNHQEDCDQILNLFSSNKCLYNAIQAQMNLGQNNQEVQDQPQFTPSLDIHGTSTMFTEKLYQEPEVKQEKEDSEILTLNQKSPQNSEFPRAEFSSLILILTLVFLFLGPP